ncbi:GAF domain-containing sensor histidine kinase [Nocardioides pyridinolyticus]
MLERQTDVLEMMARAAPLREVLDEILTSLEHLMGGSRCSVLLLDRARGTLHHGAAPSLGEEYVCAIDGMAIGDGAGSCGTAAALNVPVVVTDVRTDPRWADFRDAAVAAGLVSCWSTPIVGRDGLPVGTFAVYHSEPHHPVGREELLVDRFTHLASVAIEHAALLKDLMESEERFRRSFDDNSLGMAIVGLNHRVVIGNPALTTLARRGHGLGGSALADLLTPREMSLDAWLDELDDVHVGPIAFEAVLHRDDLAGVEVEVTVSLLRDPDGTPQRYLVNVFDLSERRAAERDRRARLEAEAARRTAEELSHAKSELLAAVGHEARTPIQAIVGFAELLGTIDLDEARRREALVHIGAAAGHVMDLLADVLDLSRLEANALPLALEPVCLRDVVLEAFDLLASTARERRFELVQHLAADVVLGDSRRLRQVVLNLVGNAIRHGYVGGRVEVSSRRAPDGSAVLVTVDDDGPGIPPDLLPRIFTPFVCATRAPGRTPTTGGLDAAHEESIGLGLGLAHGLVRAMGGDLSVGRSGPTGTSVHLRLPRPDPVAARNVS